MIKAVLCDQIETLSSTSLLRFFQGMENAGESYLVEQVAIGESAFPDAVKLLKGVKADFEVMETHAKDVEDDVSFLANTSLHSDLDLAEPSHGT